MSDGDIARDGTAIRYVRRGEDGYPPQLLDLHDPPAGLYLRGGILPPRDRLVAMVGARACSAGGADIARAIARGLASAGFAVVSGAARGIDARDTELHVVDARGCRGRSRGLLRRGGARERGRGAGRGKKGEGEEEPVHDPGLARAPGGDNGRCGALQARSLSWARTIFARIGSS